LEQWFDRQALKPLGIVARRAAFQRGRRLLGESGSRDDRREQREDRHDAQLLTSHHRRGLAAGAATSLITTF